MYLAHISDDGRKQTIKEHLENTAELAATFASPFGMDKTAYNAGLLHDIGKYSEAFQKRLFGGPKVDHSTAGALESYRRRMAVEAFCVAGHHSGIPNGGGRADIEGSSLNARIRRAEDGDIPLYDAWKDEIRLLFSKEITPRDMLELSYKIRMIYSCLVDADYLDTERFMTGDVDRGRKFVAENLLRKLNEYIAPWFPAKNRLNMLRCEILEHVMDEGRKIGRGLYSFTVPTGGGKTVASLAFAIEHAKKNGFNRIVYVIPYTSIIEQTADIFRQILGDDNVLEHHSNVEQGEDDESLFYMRATENWDMPVIVTTSVQFFESFYNNKSSSCRKLHNVANSIIIFDEAQMLPIPFLKPCVSLMVELVKHYRVSVVLCTATQPALDGIIREFDTAYMPYELCPKQYYDDSLFERVSYKRIGIVSYDELMKYINTEEQCLCIVNSKKAAQDIYSLMSGEGCFHLSTNMYPAHRKRVLEEIKDRLKNKQSCKVVATSLIEAGVDVDFPCVYRQLAGIDSILQAGGRCNREGKRDKSKSLVYIFDLECGSPEMFSTQIASADYVMNNYEDFISKEAIKAFFNQLLYLNGSDSLDQYKIIEQMKKPSLPFQDVADQFHLIANNTQTLYVECEDNRSLLEKIRLGVATKKEYRKIGLYGINIYEYQYQKLKQHRAIEDISEEICILIDTSLYNEDIGLTMDFVDGEAIMI